MNELTNEFATSELMSHELAARFAPVIAVQPYPLLFVTVSGAHLYGFPSPDSDYDLRGMHALPAHEVFGLDVPMSTVDETTWHDGVEVDISTHDIRKYFELLLKKSGNMLEQIVSPLVIVTTPVHDELKTIAPSCITRHFAHHYLGIAKTQWGFFEKTRQVKPLLYVYRSLLSGFHLVRTGEVEANLVNLNARYPHAYLPDLIAQKMSGTEHGTLEHADFTFHQAEVARLRAMLETAFAETNLPEEPAGRASLNDLLVRTRSRQWQRADKKVYELI